MIASLKTQVTKMKSFISGLSKKLGAINGEKKKKKKIAPKLKVVEIVTPKATILKPSTPKQSLMKKKNSGSKKRQRSPNIEKISPLHKRIQMTSTEVKKVSHPIIVATPFQQLEPSQLNSTTEKSIQIIDQYIDYLQLLKRNSINYWKQNNFAQLSLD